jgi:hypothetical protein
VVLAVLLQPEQADQVVLDIQVLLEVAAVVVLAVIAVLAALALLLLLVEPVPEAVAVVE